MRQMVDGKRDFASHYKNADVPIEVKSHAELLQGTLPSQVELIKTGKVRQPSYRRGNMMDRSDKFVIPEPELIAMAEADEAR